MCVVDAADREAAVARFLLEYPRIERAAGDHPALLGCDDVDWSRIPGCPAAIPVLLRSLLDEAAGPGALRVLDTVLMNSVVHVSAAMPAALPFLIRLAAVPDLAVRPGLLDLLVIAAVLSSPLDDGETPIFGEDCDHPEREWCRAAFATHASALRALLDDETVPDGLVSAEDRQSLLKAVEPHR